MRSLGTFELKRPRNRFGKSSRRRKWVRVPGDCEYVIVVLHHKDGSDKDEVELHKVQHATVNVGGKTYKYDYIVLTYNSDFHMISLICLNKEDVGAGVSG